MQNIYLVASPVLRKKTVWALYVVICSGPALAHKQQALTEIGDQVLLTLFMTAL